ncbi:MAG: hypothetical protein VX278_08140 [Myxococcota bacterium]|nr:hypothetical protein [Myxococcota bacterium]
MGVAIKDAFGLRPHWMMGMLLLGMCSCSRVSSESESVLKHVPEHSECFDAPISDAVCYDVISAHDQQPTQSYNQSGIPAAQEDDRLQDPDYIWLAEEVKQCVCSCCHNSQLEGSGTFFWDVAFEPVWIDSANLWSLSVLAGETEEPDQTLPVSDMERLRVLIDRERDRRLQP